MNTNEIKVLFFDVNETLLGLAEVRRSVAQALNGKEEIVSLWFEMLLHYSLVSNASDEFQNFVDIGAAVLNMLASKQGIKMDLSSAKEVLKPIRTSPPHPEVPGALEKLQAQYKLAALTNSERVSMELQLENAGISKYFDRQFSVEDIGLYKPDRHVYRWAARQMQTSPENCLFIAAHSWDVAGAMSAGMQAAFLSRPGQQQFPLSPAPDYNAANLTKLASALSANN